MESELRRVKSSSGGDLWALAERYSAVDAAHFDFEPQREADVDPQYTLGDQLFVEPQPLALPTRLELTAPIKMSRPEVAVARSHINVWRQVASGSIEYVLVLEDDVWFRRGFARTLDSAWGEIERESKNSPYFDILYLSYEEVKHGAPKVFLSTNVFRPTRGLWHLSGYVISRQGAQKLLRLLPCRGPIDLWINHQFERLEVRATKRSIISQRRDLGSTNSYSILPTLTKIGAITSESASLFQFRPNEKPVFAFGPPGSGLTSLAMALSMLGYRCCSDLESLPPMAETMLFEGKKDQMFDAYVNVDSLFQHVTTLKRYYPQAKFIITSREAGDVSHLNIKKTLAGADGVVLPVDAPHKWQIVCEHLRCPPPVSTFPSLPDLGQRPLLDGTGEPDVASRCVIAKRDRSPWIAEPRTWWQGIRCAAVEVVNRPPVRITDELEYLDARRWLAREDTFTDNLALFRAANLQFQASSGAVLTVRRELLGVREYSAAALTSRHKFLFGRFEAVAKVSDVPGVVSGVFLHRDSPRQEIDIEIAGNRADRLLVNVFYNPGSEGSKYDYGYRGAASYIDLGFDASESFHRYAIEWGPCEVRWFVDDRLVHRRADWDPTPIPHLPMSFHVNIWPTRSKELAGRLVGRRLPATTCLRSIVLEAHQAEAYPLEAHEPEVHTIL